MNIPEGLDSDRRYRLKNCIPTEITSKVTLAKNSRRVDFKTSFENRSKDQLVTVRLPINIQADSSYSECPFDVRKRPIGTVGSDGGIIDDRLNLTRHVMHNFVSVSNSDMGAAVFTKGLKECEVSTERERYGECGHTLINSSSVVNLTLLRAVSNTIPIHDDLFVDFTDEPSQCIGKHTFEYAMEFYNDDWFTGKVIPSSRKYMLPLIAAQLGRGEGGVLPISNSFFELKEANLTLSCIKQAEDGVGTIIRLYNPSSTEVSETIRLCSAVKSVYMTELDETIQDSSEELINQGNEITIKVKPFKIITLKINDMGYKNDQ
jgi:alpha-mannosidase